MRKRERELREAIIETCRRMNALGINQGTSGNVSARLDDRLLITPSGVPYEALQPGDIAATALADPAGTWDGPLPPSSEWRFHLDILRARPAVGAVVHTHSPYATALSMTRREIPACHYMIAAAGGPSVRCADYATYGTKELSNNALAALEGRTCCLLANHGTIATGSDLAEALWLAVEIEALARQYCLSLSLGGPVILPDDEIERVVEKFKSYGPRAKPAAAKPAGKRAARRKSGAAE